MAASSAPFGTDLQSPTMAKIVAGKVLYVSKASTAIQLSAVSPSRREELVETVNAPSTKTVMSPVATSSILHLNISDHTFSRIISDCRLHSKSLKYIEKLRLFEILINNEVRVSTEQLSMLIDASGSSIDYYHVDYMEFLSTLKNMTNRFEKPNKPVANQEEMRETLSPLRLSKTCPPNFFTPRENFSPLNFKSRSSNHHTRPSTELDRSKTFKHGCNNNDSRAGVKNLISALRKCSNIRGKIDKDRCIRLIKLYNTVYRIGFPLDLIRDIDSNCTDLFLVNTEHVVQYIVTVTDANVQYRKYE